MVYEEDSVELGSLVGPLTDVVEIRAHCVRVASLGTVHNFIEVAVLTNLTSGCTNL